jgi:hypothetical protein
MHAISTATALLLDDYPATHRAIQERRFVRPSGTCPRATSLAVYGHALTLGAITPGSQPI